MRWQVESLRRISVNVPISEESSSMFLFSGLLTETLLMICYPSIECWPTCLCPSYVYYTLYSHLQSCSDFFFLFVYINVAPPSHKSLGNAPVEPHPRSLSDSDWLGLGQPTRTSGSAFLTTTDSISFPTQLLISPSASTAYFLHYRPHDGVWIHSWKVTLTSQLFTSQIFTFQLFTSQLFSNTVFLSDEAGRFGAFSLSTTMTAVSRHQASLSNLSKQSQCSSPSTKSKQNLTKWKL